MNVEVFSNPVCFQGRTLLHAIIVDMTGRLAAEQELRDKMDFAENLILNSTTPTFVINFNHQVLIWNRALEELTGIAAADVIGTDEHWRAFYPIPRPCLADAVLDGNHKEILELYTHLSRSRLIPDGLRAEGDYSFGNRRCRLVFSSAPIHDRDGEIIAAIQTLEDVTERISLEAQLYQAQKMESVGELAGGIAHEFNNVLTIINGYADLLQITLANDEENLLFAREISTSVDRAADMTRSLLAFSGKHEMLLQYDDLNLLTANIRKSLERLIREDIALSINVGMEQLPVYIDRVQIEQVLINLVVNACDAIGSGGAVTVTTVQSAFKEAYLEGNATIPPGQYACLSVHDNGSGMDGKTLERLFEPFFTTKEKGRGTGLGLAIVHSIVSKHNGHISVITAPGNGTEFRFYLPLYSGKSSLKQADAVQAINHHGTETVLMAEDDENLMKLHKEVLGRYGYTIITAADGVEAIEVFNAHADKIHIAVVDVIMPKMNGREVVEHIRRQRPGLPVIMTSGYTADIIDLAVIEQLRVAFLQKPVKPLELLATIRACINWNK
jgi:signal transduction histidine kinase/CheY-like chemotaxis protein